MIKLLAAAILGLSILGGGATGVPVQQIDVEPQNDIHIQTQGEHDGLYDEDIAKLYDNASNEPNLGINYFYAPHYFSNLYENFGNNYFGTCGYVATGMLLSFWDTYWDDNIIPEQYERVTWLDNNKLSYGLESPGIQSETDILNGVTISDYYQAAQNNSGQYFQFLLMTMSKGLFGAVQYDSKTIDGLLYKDYNDLYEYYVYEYCGYSQSDVEVLNYAGRGTGINRSKDVRSYAISLVKQGIPVKLGISHNYNSYDGTHAVVAYDYNEEKDELYCHMGWGPNTTHVTIESMGYTSYNNLFAFNFKNSHKHSNNYVYNTTTHCACHYVVPYHVNLLNGNYRDSAPTYKWNSLNREKWFAEQDLKYEFSILDQNRHPIFTTKTLVDEYQLTQKQWNDTLELPNGIYYAYVEPYSDVYPYWDDYGYTEQFKVSASDFKLTHVIKPSDYGFYKDVYPTDANTMNNYSSHNVNGFSFRTKRYRTGYIQSEYIVLSPIRNNISEAFIEYNFDEPVLRIDVQLSHWRSYSSEKLSSSNGTFTFELNNNNRWTPAYNLLSSSYNLPTDRTSPKWYTFEFGKPIYGFRLHATSSLGYTKEDNKGRICIGDLAIWTQLPLSGYELDYNEALWKGVPSKNNNCYAYALNNQLDPRDNSIWRKQQPGALGGEKIKSPLTKDRIVSAVENDFEKYNQMYNTNLIFREVERFEVCPEGTYKVALVTSNDDYHWYRQNADGTWSHKHSLNPVQNVDESNNIILDPRLCDRGEYVNFLGYFAVSPWGNMYNA